jgi:hypothetical protein
MEIIHFHNNTSIHNQIYIFQSLRNLNFFENISFSEILNSLNVDENTYILSLSSKLRKVHMFLKPTP